MKKGCQLINISNHVKCDPLSKILYKCLSLLLVHSGQTHLFLIPSPDYAKKRAEIADWQAIWNASLSAVLKTATSDSSIMRCVVTHISNNDYNENEEPHISYTCW